MNTRESPMGQGLNVDGITLFRNFRTLRAVL